jgi:hypothetical protein
MIEVKQRMRKDGIGGGGGGGGEKEEEEKM